MANAKQLPVVQRLETLHQDKGLKFTQGFTEEKPNKAYGHLNGERFNFRFEYLEATLRVGPYDRKIEELFLERKKDLTNPVLDILDAFVSKGHLTETDKELYLKHHPHPTLREENDVNFTPLILNQVSSFDYDDGTDECKEKLSEEDIFAVFNTLIETLDTPKNGAGLPPLAATLLHEGWTEYSTLLYGDNDYNYGFKAADDILNVDTKTNSSLMQAVANMLEEKYETEGLHFLEGGFRGAVPVQAYGHVRGMRFYFRFRGNVARIKIGPYVQELEDLRALRDEESEAKHLADLEEKFANNEVDLASYTFQKDLLSSPSRHRVSKPEDTQFLPTQLVHMSACEGPTPGDDYNGYLDEMESIMIFSRLMDNLEDIPEEEQIDEYTKILLYQGWDAALEWREKNYGF